MRNQNIAKVLKEYRKRNHLSVNDVSILLEDRSFTAAPKTIYGMGKRTGKSKRRYPFNTLRSI